MAKDIQLALVDGKALTKTDVMSAMDLVVKDLYQTNDMSKATHVLDVLNKIEETSGHAKAKLLWNMKSWWDETGQTEKRNDTFEDYVVTRSSTRKVTVSRYVNVWECIENLSIPKEFHEFPMRELVPIASTIAQGYDIEREHWNELKKCTSDAEVRQVLRDVKGKEAKKSARTLFLERDGTLNLWKNNKKYFIGYLDTKATDEETIKAIERIVVSSGIIRR